MHFSTMYDCQTSSSSSSSVSGIATPVDGIAPKLVAFPKTVFSKNGLTSSGSSSSSLDNHRVRSLSFSRASHSFSPRPVKLSLESKASPIPAIPSASEDDSPHGAFSLTSSAEGHLRSLVTRAGPISQFTPSKVADGLPQLTSEKQRERKSSLRMLPAPWASISDIEEEDAFWPRHNPVIRHDVPSISRSPSPQRSSGSGSPGRSNLRSRFASARSVTAPHPETIDSAKLRKPAHVRANTYAGRSAQPPVETASRSNVNASSHPRAFLRPATNRKARNVTAPPPSGSSAAPKEIGTLDPALAAAESASRFRAKCVCAVCGKLGVDYPRCPRCTATWCSRDCRMSSAPAGSARHSCNGKNKRKGPSVPSPRICTA